MIKLLLIALIFQTSITQKNNVLFTKNLALNPNSLYKSLSKEILADIQKYQKNQNQTYLPGVPYFSDPKKLTNLAATTTTPELTVMQQNAIQSTNTHQSCLVKLKSQISTCNINFNFYIYAEPTVAQAATTSATTTTAPVKADATSVLSSAKTYISRTLDGEDLHLSDRADFLHILQSEEDCINNVPSIRQCLIELYPSASNGYQQCFTMIDQCRRLEKCEGSSNRVTCMQTCIGMCDESYNYILTAEKYMIDNLWVLSSYQKLVIDNLQAQHPQKAGVWQGDLDRYNEKFQSYNIHLKQIENTKAADLNEN